MNAGEGGENITIHPIGIVSNKITSQNKTSGMTQESRIVIEKKYVRALKGLSKYSHVIVLYWLNHAANSLIRIMAKAGNRPYLPKVGIFATRNTRNRPNRIGLTVVRLLTVNSNIIGVIGLDDAFNESPVIDIKPLMRWDIVEETKPERRVHHESMELKFAGKVLVPKWWRRF